MHLLSHDNFSCYCILMQKYLFFIYQPKGNKFKLADLETQLNLQIVNKTWLLKQYSSFPKDALLDQTLLFTIFTTTNTR